MDCENEMVLRDLQRNNNPIYFYVSLSGILLFEVFNIPPNQMCLCL